MSPRLMLASIIVLLWPRWSVGKTALDPVIYPRPNRVLRFSHRGHAETECLTCHPSVRSSSSPLDRNLPAESACRPCHGQTRKQDLQRQGPAKSCSVCHAGYSGKGPPVGLDYPTANLRFAHRLHLDKGLGCEACHRFVEDRALPSMTTCRNCHRRQGASERCTVCHLSNKDGRVRTRYPSGVLKDINHTQLFKSKHAAAARANRRYCESCHQPRSCLSCHGGKLRPMAIHGGDYISRHVQDARRNQPRCSSCHRSQTFCLGCHQRTGVGTETRGSMFRPTTDRRFHREAFTGMATGPGHHGHAARRNMRTCTGCHREQTCIRCHGTRGRGRAGFSPHPPAFGLSSKCRSLSARNQRVCLKCHPPGDRLIRCR